MECRECGKSYKYRLLKHQAACTPHSPQTPPPTETNTTQSQQLHNIFPFEDTLFTVDQHEELTYIAAPEIDETYLDELISSAHKDKLSILLNINSVHNKLPEVHRILDLGQFEAVIINEGKLSDATPSKALDHRHYRSFRRDRQSNGGGILIYIKRSLPLISEFHSTDYELIHFIVGYNGTQLNFVCPYRPPNENVDNFINYLENYISSIDQHKSITVVGDLNINMIPGKKLEVLATTFNLVNYVTKPTRTMLYKNGNLSSTTIDVILNNQEMIETTSFIPCPFSDHCFVSANFNLSSTESKIITTRVRTINTTQLAEITDQIRLADLIDNGIIDKFDSINDKWLVLKNLILDIVHKNSTMKKISNNANRFPWFDNELQKLRTARDKLYKIAIATKTSSDWANYKTLRNNFSQLHRRKMTNFFAEKTSKSFKSTVLRPSGNSIRHHIS